MEIKDLLEDSEKLYEESLKEMEVNLRDAAEKAWGATVKATAALLIAKGKAKEWKDVKYVKPRRVLLGFLQEEDEKVKHLGIYERYCVRSDILHGACFYEGICEPRNIIERRIVETKSYIEDVKKLIFVTPE
jgi:hypothetical protein